MHGDTKRLFTYQIVQFIIRCKPDVLNNVAFKYSCHKFRKTIIIISCLLLQRVNVPRHSTSIIIISCLFLLQRVNVPQHSTSIQTVRLLHYIDSIDRWMSSNCLKLNADQTVHLLGSPQQLQKTGHVQLTVGGIDVIQHIDYKIAMHDVQLHP